MNLLTEKAIEQARCSGCQVKSCGRDVADLKAEPTAGALSQAVIHSVGAPLMGSLCLVVMADVLGMGDAGQTMAAALGLGLGMLFCTGMTAWPSGWVKAAAGRVDHSEVINEQG
ncbi:MAG: hypothetical protein ACO391_13990 [Pseudomonadales bacterium]|jgi:hypothetical protein